MALKWKDKDKEKEYNKLVDTKFEKRKLVDQLERELAKEMRNLKQIDDVIAGTVETGTE